MSRKQVLVSLVTLVVLLSGLMAACAAPTPAPEEEGISIPELLCFLKV